MINEKSMKTLLKLAFFIIMLFVGVIETFTQVSLTSSGKYFLSKNYTTQNGLINNVIWSIAQEKNGYVWIGSDLGLTRFDGKSFFHKAIPEIYNNSGPVQYIETTPGGTVISTSLMQGVFVQQEYGRFKKYLRTGYVELGKNVFNCLKYCPDKTILASTSSILSLISENSIKPLYDSGSNTRLFLTLDVDSENRIWFGGQLGLGMLQRSGTTYEPVFLPEFKNIYIVKILFDAKGTLHVATSQGYYRIVWLSDKRYRIEQPFDVVKDNYINHIYLDKAGNLWIPTTSYGVFRTHEDSITLHLTQETGLISSTVLCMMQDRENNYWFGTNNGISRIENFDNFAIAQNGNRFKEANGMKADSYNRIWLYSGNQLNVYQNDQLVPVHLDRTPLEKAGIHDLELFHSNLIISNPNGLYQLPVTKGFPDLRMIKKIADYPENNITLLRSLRMDTTGIWICTQNKVYNYNNGLLLPVLFNHPDSSSRRPIKMLQDRYGYYWYADYTYGLYRGTLSRSKKNTLVFDNITAYKSLKADSAFVTAWIQDMCFDKAGYLWFSTLYTGVYKLTIDNNGVVSDQLYSTESGLLSNKVSGIYSDDKGGLWFTTHEGINFLQYDSAGVESMAKLDKNEGIEGQVYSALQKGNGLFILTEEGAYITQNQLFNKKTDNMPDVFITNLLVNGVVDSIYSTHNGYIRLSHSQNNITIEYSAIQFQNADDVRYQYKLEGANDEWSVLSDRGFVEFSSLRPGRYTFKVRAVMNDHSERKANETTLSFHIRPAYYQTVWFYSLMVLLVFTLLFALYRYRVKHLIKIERMRMRIASDLHDDIGSTLSSISLISEMASQQDQEALLVKALSKISKDSRAVLNSMDDIIWSVNPQNDSLSNLITRLREYAIPVCESKNITFQMHVDETIFVIKLGMDERRNIYLIVKEAINNAIKHSGCSCLTVTFSLNHKLLEIQITDNGCGFDPSKRGLRNGVTGMERRAKQIGSELNIRSEKGSGSTLILESTLS